MKKIKERTMGLTYRVIKFDGNVDSIGHGIELGAAGGCASGGLSRMTIEHVYSDMDETILLPGRYTARIVKSIVIPFDKDEIMVIEMEITEGAQAGAHLRRRL